MRQIFAGRLLGRWNVGSEPAWRQNMVRGCPGSDSAAIRHQDWLEHHTTEEHAVLLIRWIRQNIDLARGVLFREAVQEFYAEAVNEVGWAARPWNPIARQLDLLCTGGAKPYTWTMTETGRMRRRRYYPVPAACLETRAA